MNHPRTRISHALAILTLGAGLFILALPTECRADPLPIAFDSNGPAIGVYAGTVTYSAGTMSGPGTLTVNATPTYFLTSNFPYMYTMSGAALTITLSVNSSGAFSSGTVALTGTVDFGTNQAVSGNLLNGTVTGFGSQGPGPAPWDFDGLFTINGGLLTQASSTPASDIFPNGSTGAFDLCVETETSGILGDYEANFSGSTIKGPVGLVATPEPTTATIAAISAAAYGAMAFVHRRRQQRTVKATGV